MNRVLLGFLGFSLAAIILSACGREEATTSDSNATMLSLTAEQTGIDFTNKLTETTELNIIEYLYYYNGGGVAIGDINNDGLEDLFFTANQGPDKLYLNKGNLKFEDISEKANILPENTWSSGVVMEDLNNDGYLDIHVCKVGVGILPEAHNLVYINQKDGTFREMSAELGLDFQGFSTQACFLDYDHDGDLDLYLLNHNVHSVRSYGTAEKRKEQDLYAGDRFFENRLNEAEQSFIDVTVESGIYSSPLGYGLAVACGDLNGDGWTDIYVGNDFHENDYIYFNNGDKTFREEVADWTDHTTQFSMGVDIADLNNDLLPDIFSTDMLPFEEEVYLKSGGEDTDQIKRIKDDLGFENQFARNHFQLNTGWGTFVDIALHTRTFASDWSWAVLLQDFDNNGNKDIFISNGIAKRPNDLDYINYLNSEAISKYAENDPERTQQLIGKLPAQKLKNILFLQSDNLHFSKIADAQVGSPSFSNGAAYADLDQDGYLEIVINNINDPATILKYNSSSGTQAYLELELNDPTGKTTNGTKVYAYTEETPRYQELQSVKGYQSSSSHRLHFGLGKATQLDSLVIIWPDQTKQVLLAVEVNQQLKISKDSSAAKQLATAVSSLGKSFDVLPLQHEENDFNDDENEKLIPEKLSREGPAVLYEDLDGDGTKDLIVGGAHGHATRLLRGRKDGSFENLEVDDFTRDARHEDVSVATIDFDGDGDKDLYIASGGSVSKELDKVLEDRIYLNNGGMKFLRIPLSLPHTNASVVAVADFDKDGYEDIFIGARSIPGSYGLSPYSFVLKNRGGTGVDIALKERLGMVTDAQWVDFGNDQDLDLVVCGDWMPITVIENDGNGMLAIATNSGLPNLSGFWKTLAFGDFNQDGQIDIVAGNLGTNTVLSADEAHPIRLYLGDFDDNGSVDPLIFYRYFNRYLPLGSKDKFVSQLPILKKRFVDYVSFSQVSSFEQLFPEGQDRLVETKEINELRSVLFLSQKEEYVSIPLPERVQTGTVQDFYLDVQKGNIYYVASNHELAAVQANAMDAKLGVTKLDVAKKTFLQDDWLPAPAGVNARAIVPLENGKYLMVTNSGYLYFVDLPQN
ncbi:VCBS repeat-containing protein [Lewinella sp. LCG006]|uniref:VCBS repeat-containing protein n=1 Tax=Lewinella sp. LCG006 TaxID=3231911 RepID=UPI00346033A3